MDTGCPHPESDLVPIRIGMEGDKPSCVWCSTCGSIRESIDGVWRPPASLVLPGWTCRTCMTFNGSAKEVLTVCRHCQTPRKPTMEQRDENG